MDNYVIRKTESSCILIDSKEWEKADVAKVTTINWNEFPHAPYTEARMLYNANGIYIKFDSDEDNIIASFKNLNDHVFKESACEIFFMPNVSYPYYFNFEFNAIGTMRVGWGMGRADRVFLELDDISIFEIESKVKEKGFSVKVFIPYSFILSYVEEISAEYFLGNFHKCCEFKNPMHFATYYPVGTPSPDFHIPQYFDKLIFER